MKHYIILITLLIFLSMLFIPMTSCKSDDHLTTIVAEYDDGSWIKTLGGPQYAHYLFDGYALYSYEGYFSQQLMIGDEEGTYTIRTYTVIENVAEGYYLMYSFDPSGYIAYYRIQKAIDENKTALYEKTIGGETVRIIDEGAFLYDCRESTEYKFNSMNELYDYSETAGIDLGQVYYSKGYGSQPEETVAAVNTWSVAKTPWGNFNIKNGKKDIFTGEIDEYGNAGDYLYFRLKITDEYYYAIGVNEGIDCDFDTAETERKGLFTTVKVYGNKYIIVNTLENTAEVFDDEDALYDYMDSINKSIQ